MPISVILISLFVVLMLAFTFGQQRSLVYAQKVSYRSLQSLPFYYGMLTLVWAALPAALLLFVWAAFQESIIAALVFNSLPEGYYTGEVGQRELILNQIYNIAYSRELSNFTMPPAFMEAAEYLKLLERYSRWVVACGVWSVAGLSMLIALFRVHPRLNARAEVEMVFRSLLFCSSFFALFITAGIIASVLFESLLFFDSVPFTDFLFGLTWDPQVAFRADQEVGNASFGAVPLFVGTLLVASIAMLVAVPTGLMSAIYISEYASETTRDWVKPLLEVLAGIPTVVYGFFAVLIVAPWVEDSVAWLVGDWLPVSPQSALAAGLVLGIMIIPFVSSISDDVINAVPQSLRDGALALGSTQSEVIKQVVLPAALPGIMSGVLLAASRAIGETMIVVMAAGLAANLTVNPLSAVTTVTVQIKTLLEGDQVFDSPETLAAFALGLMLFCVTLGLNYIALHIVRKFREQYE